MYKVTIKKIKLTVYCYSHSNYNIKLKNKDLIKLISLIYIYFEGF